MPIIDTHNHFIPEQLWQSAGTAAPLTLQYRDGTAVAISFGQQELGPLTPGLLDLDIQLQDMEGKGLDYRVITLPPYLSLYGLAAEAGAAWARQANEALVETARQAGNRLIPIGTVPMQDGATAARELAYAVNELGMSGVQITTHINGVDLDAPELRPFWEAAAALSCVVFVHPTSVRGDHFSSEYYLRNLVGNPTETTVAGARILFSGLLEAFPTLRICLVHGGGTLPYLIGRLAHGFVHRPECQEQTTVSPVELLRRFYFDTVVFHPPVLAALASIVGVDRVVLGTDHPYDMGELDPLGLVRQSGLGEAAETAIVSRTPLQMLGLDHLLDEKQGSIGGMRMG